GAVIEVGEVVVRVEAGVGGGHVGASAGGRAAQDSAAVWRSASGTRGQLDINGHGPAVRDPRRRIHADAHSALPVPATATVVVPGGRPGALRAIAPATGRSRQGTIPGWPRSRNHPGSPAQGLPRRRRPAYPRLSPLPPCANARHAWR